MDADLRVSINVWTEKDSGPATVRKVPIDYKAILSPTLTTRTVTALNRLLDTHRRNLPAEDFAALACLRDTLANCLASGKAYEGSLSTYE